jgi:hypothetical protein
MLQARGKSVRLIMDSAEKRGGALIFNSDV